MSTGNPVVSTFSEQFQTETLALMLNKPAFLKACVDLIQPDFFDNRVHRSWASMLLDLQKRFPTDDVTESMVISEFRRLKDAKKLPVEDFPVYAKTLADMKSPPPNPTWIETEIRNFASDQSMRNALIESYMLAKDGKHKEIVDRITKAYELPRRTISEQAAISVVKKRAEFFARLRDPEDLGAKKGIPTGISALDKILFAGGVDKKEMLVVCGPPGRGKSPSLLNFAATSTRLGKHTLFYTLEVKSEICQQRYNSILTSVPMTEMHRSVDILETRWGILDRHFQFADLKLVEKPARKLTPNQIRADLRYYIDIGDPIEVLVVDYADIMASDRKISLENRRLEHGDVYEELRAIAQEFDIVVYTASQGNRGSLNAKEVDLDDFAEDFSKAFTADYVIGLSQTKKEKAMRPEAYPDFGTGHQRFFVAKNRNEARGENIELWTDFTRMRLSGLADWVPFDEKYFGLSLKAA